MRKRHLILASLILGLPAATPVLAQQADPTLVAKFLVVSGLDSTARANIDKIVNAPTAPALAPYRDIIVSWRHRYISWAVERPLMVASIRKHFTNAELRRLIAFYQTPTGRREIQARVEVATDLTNYLVSTQQANQAELTREIRQRADSLARAKRATP